MALFKAQLSAGPFKRGEIVNVDPKEFAGMIEKGWLKPWAGEGTLTVEEVDGEPRSLVVDAEAEDVSAEELAEAEATLDAMPEAAE